MTREELELRKLALAITADVLLLHEQGKVRAQLIAERLNGRPADVVLKVLALALITAATFSDNELIDRERREGFDELMRTNLLELQFLEKKVDDE